MQKLDPLIDEFNTRGYIILRRMLQAHVVADVIAELEKWVDAQAQKWRDSGQIADLCADEPFERRLVCLHEQLASDSAAKTLRRELHWPGMFGLFFQAQLLDLVESILGPEIRLYPNYSIRPKLPQHAPTKVLWHQDAGYTSSGLHGGDAKAGNLRVDQLRMVNAWSPLVPARIINGCMKFVPGSHKLGVVPHESREFYLEIVPEALEPHLKDAVDIECDPGDVVLFSNLLFHMGQDNAADIVRWSTDWRYQDATQSTLRADRGHLARSAAQGDKVVRSAEHWAQLSFI